MEKSEKTQTDDKEFLKEEKLNLTFEITLR